MRNKIITTISWITAILIIMLIPLKKLLLIPKEIFNVIMGIGLILVSVILLLKEYFSNRKFTIVSLIAPIVFFLISLYYLLLL
ncbi:hypothetical protein [Tepidimicrobium xylanilyticum]|uniref:Uncharacterized protein n=1 Tax=Tepidimicrobium xylanilyticum TaxID=1123352 RepID=A0A1H3EFF7_9FIRM|nr:hypothetical protein [Tepidimicrobium xylanilyticum]SDX77365.1 hypothetical protein SAMN05660923_02912 [Tepidimicrobium xylanilyticum]